MINQYEVPAYLVDELPGIEKELKVFSPTLNIFKTVQCLANYTKSKIIQHDLGTVKKYFAIAEEVYVKGNELVKGAIENVFVFSFSSLLNMGSREEKKELQAIIPVCLHTIYVQQVLRSGM
jgi:hypothetical protein